MICVSLSFLSALLIFFGLKRELSFVLDWSSRCIAGVIVLDVGLCGGAMLETAWKKSSTDIWMGALSSWGLCVSLSVRFMARLARLMRSILFDQSRIASAASLDAILMMTLLIFESRLRSGLLFRRSISDDIWLMMSMLCIPVHIWCPKGWWSANLRYLFAMMMRSGSWSLEGVPVRFCRMVEMCVSEVDECWCCAVP